MMVISRCSGGTHGVVDGTAVVSGVAGDGGDVERQSISQAVTGVGAFPWRAATSHSSFSAARLRFMT